MNRTSLWLILIIFIGLIVRLIAAWTTNSFWFDEVVSASIAKLPLPQTWQYLQWENNPPLHFWYLNIWGHLFGFSDFILKLSSVVVGTFNVFLVFLFGKKLFSKKVGLLAALLAAVSSFMIFYSQEARMYPLVFLFGTLSLHFFWNWHQGRKSEHLMLSGLFTLLGLYTHLTLLVVPVIQLIFLLVTKNKNVIASDQRESGNPGITSSSLLAMTNEKTIAKWLIAQLIILIGWLPWLINFIQTKLEIFSPGAWYFQTERFNFFLLEVPKQFLLFAGDIGFIEMLSLIFFGLLFLASIFKIDIDKAGLKIKWLGGETKIFLLLILFVPLLLGFLLNVNIVKYYTVASLGLFVLLALGLEKILKELKEKNLLLYGNFIIILIVLLMLPATIKVSAAVSPGWTRVVKFIEENEKPGDVILAASYAYALPVDYYYGGDLPVKDFYPLMEEGDLLTRVLKRNWYPLITETNINQLADYTQSAERIFLVSSAKIFVVENDLVKQWFFKNDWRLVDNQTFNGLADPNILILKRPE